MNGLVSIIIVNYNGKRWLKKCVDSLLCQTYGNFEIILVDNASADDSVDFIENNYRDSRIKVVRSDKNLGFAGGNNLGMKKSSGECVLFLNNDTWIDEDLLQKMVDFYVSNDYDAIGPLENDYENTLKKRYIFRMDIFGHSVRTVFGGPEKAFYLSGVCLFFRREFYMETLGLDNDFFMYMEDVDWFWRIHLLKKKVGIMTDRHVHHAGAGSTGAGIKYQTFLWRNQNTLQMLLKNYKLFSLLWVLPIYIIQNIFEIIFFLLVLRPKIAYSYIQGWWFNIVNFSRTMSKRKWVQENRKVGDFKIMKKRMYIGFGKLNHLLVFCKIHE